MSLPGPRTITLNTTGLGLVALVDPPGELRTTAAKNVCQESRMVFLSNYEPAFSGILQRGKAIYVDWEYDCISFSDTDALSDCSPTFRQDDFRMYPVQRYVKAEDIRKWQTKVRHLAVGKPLSFELARMQVLAGTLRTLRSFTFYHRGTLFFSPKSEGNEEPDLVIVNRLQQLWQLYMMPKTVIIPRFTLESHEVLNLEASAKTVRSSRCSGEEVLTRDRKAREQTLSKLGLSCTLNIQPLSRHCGSFLSLEEEECLLLFLKDSGGENQRLQIILELHCELGIDISRTDGILRFALKIAWLHGN